MEGREAGEEVGRVAKDLREGKRPGQGVKNRDGREGVRKGGREGGREAGDEGRRQRERDREGTKRG